eukprot:evm.model.scf_1161.4 EVM.evm.TU.scf_1161.4   scf_1161:37124-43122(+)
MADGPEPDGSERDRSGRPKAPPQRPPPLVVEPQPWVRRLWGKTSGTASLYIKKPTLPPLIQYDNIFRLRPTDRRKHFMGQQDGGRSRGAAAYLREQSVHKQDKAPTEGAEVRVLRRVWWAEKALDLGIGLRMGVSPVQLTPVVRIRLWDSVTIKAFPTPLLKISRALPFEWMGMTARLRYEVPFLAEDMDSLWKPPARLLLRLEPQKNSGLHFYPGGLELGDNKIPLGNGTTLRAAAGLNFPRQFPYDGGEEGPSWEIRRLGLKTAW